MRKPGEPGFIVHPALESALRDFAYLQLPNAELSSSDRAIIEWMQTQILEVLRGTEPTILWRAPPTPGRESRAEDAERDCSIANAILLEGYDPTIPKGELDAIKLKVVNDWNTMREQLAGRAIQPPRITLAIATHAWRRCITAARAQHGSRVCPVAFRVRWEQEYPSGKYVPNFLAVLVEPPAARLARRAWLTDPRVRGEFLSEAGCVAYALHNPDEPI